MREQLLRVWLRADVAADVAAAEELGFEETLPALLAVLQLVCFLFAIVNHL